eukprot:4678042-Prymnesium_polylepis.2
MEDDVRHLARAAGAVDVVAQLCEPAGVVHANAAGLAVLTRCSRLDIVARAHVDGCSAHEAPAADSAL